MISGAFNVTDTAMSYIDSLTIHDALPILSLESCDMQLLNSISYICVSVVYESKRPVRRSLVHGMDHPAVCDMMSGPLRFLLRFLYHWQSVICSFSTVYHMYVYP